MQSNNSQMVCFPFVFNTRNIIFFRSTLFRYCFRRLWHSSLCQDKQIHSMWRRWKDSRSCVNCAALVTKLWPMSYVSCAVIVFWAVVLKRSQGTRLFETLSRGQMPDPATFLTSSHVVEMKVSGSILLFCITHWCVLLLQHRLLYINQRDGLPPICTHNVVNDADDEILCALRRFVACHFYFLFFADCNCNLQFAFVQ